MSRLVTIALFLLFPTIVVAGVPAWAAMPEGDQPTRKEVRIAGIVLKWIRTDKEANLRRAEAMIREAAAGSAQIVCTTECFLDGYAIADKSIPLDKYRALGEPIPDGPCYKRLADLARELKILLVAGMLEADGEARCNTAVLISPEGRLLGKYRKQHLEHELVRTVANGRVFLMDYVVRTGQVTNNADGRDRLEGSERVLCLDTDTGQMLWKHAYDRAYYLSYPGRCDQGGGAVHVHARPPRPRVPHLLPRPLRHDQRGVGAGECRLGRQVRVTARQRRGEEPARDAQWCRSVAAEPLPR